MNRPLAVVTAGGTREAIDDVRVLANGSTGRFGTALAEALLDQGFRVLLLLSDGSCVRPDPRLDVQRFGGHADLDAAIDRAMARTPDLVIMAAAVADYLPETREGKLRSNASHLTLTLERAPKLLATLRQRSRPTTLIVGFKLLSHVTEATLIDTAHAQVQDLQLDYCVANDLRDLGAGLHPVRLVHRDGQVIPIHGTRTHVTRQLAALFADHLPLPEPTVCPHEPAYAVELPGLPRHVDTHHWLLARSAWSNPTLDLPTDGELTQVVRHHLATQGTALRQPFSASVGPGRTLLRLSRGAWNDAQHLWRRLGADVDGRVQLPRPIWWGSTLLGMAVEDQSSGTFDIRLDEDRWTEERRLAALTSTVPAWTARATFPHTSTQGLLEAGFTPDDEGRWHGPHRHPDAQPAAAALLVHRASGHVLLGERRVEPHRGRWAAPGGKLESVDDTLEATARRELTEETALVAPPWAPACSIQIASGPYHLRCFVWEVDVLQEGDTTEEFAPEWLTLADALQHASLTPGAWLAVTRVQQLMFG